MKTYLSLDTSNIIVGIITSETPLEGSETPLEGLVEISKKPKLKRGTLYKYEDGEIIEAGIDERFYHITAKRERNYLVSQIKVTTTTGKVFDGDEQSQDRMLRAINIAAVTGQSVTDWKLADNTIVEVTLDELKEALSLAGQEMSRIWLKQ